MHHSPTQTRRQELVLFDTGNARSLASLLPEAFVTQLRALYDSDDSYLLELNERRLLKELARRGETPGPRDQALRLRFWFEYDRIQDEADNNHRLQMNLVYVIGRQIPKEVFYKHYITRPGKLAHLLCPPTDYVAALELTLEMATYKMQEYLEDVELNDVSVQRVVKIFQTLLNRYSGVKAKGKVGRPPETDEPGEEGTPPAEETPAQRLERMRAERAAAVRDEPI